ncbi:MAG: aminoacyl-tRNA hydrolase, partial [Actinomycetota bacterium]|nr:aminoacyl-tRNA hydrolase [Actinomycetota bacterium]
HDDMDIPAGEVRKKSGGGSGGHRGLYSVESELESRDFWRVRIGVGRPPGGMDPVDFLLSDFEESQDFMVEEFIDHASKVALEIISGLALQ